MKKNNSKKTTAQDTNDFINHTVGEIDRVQRKLNNARKNLKKNNSLGESPINGVFDSAGFNTSMMSQPFELAASNQYNPLSLNRILLSYSYVTHGIIQTVIDQPVEDAFRGGIEFKCDELSPEDIDQFQEYLEKCKVIKQVKDAMKWARLFGGAALIINTDQDPKTELDVTAINDNSPLAFIAADRWEVALSHVNVDETEIPYNYYGQPLHRSRVIKIMGKEAPSFIRKRLQGWGMSEVERMIRDINGYVKNQDVIFELLDEAKIDVWHIEGFNSNILSKLAQGQVSERLRIATQTKNFHNALVMDKEDEYEQKQLTFAGLGEMLNQIRIGAAAAVRMPMSKVFGLSASGFDSGEDDIENYNSLVESEVRAKAREVLSEVIPLCCLQFFGFIPESLKYEFKPLRVLSALEEEQVKTEKYTRAKGMWQDGVFTGEEYCDHLKQDKILLIDTEVSKGLREPEPPMAAFDEGGGGDDGGAKPKPKGKKNAKSKGFDR